MKRALFAAAWALVFLGITSFPTQVTSDSLDSAWPVALADGFARRWQGGVDLAFTYGPYGWLHGAAYLPGFFYPVIALEVVFKGVLAAWLTRAGLALARPAALAFFVLAAWIAREDALLWLGFWLVWRGLPDRSRAEQALACAWLALLALVKSTFLVVGAVAVVIRRAPRFGAAWAGAVVALWALAGRGLAGFPAWLSYVLEIVRGYPEGMSSFDRPAAEIVAAAVACASVAWGARRELSLLDVVVGFAVFKQAFVRHDAYHAGSFWAFLALWPLVAGAPRRVAVGAAVVGLAMLGTLRDLPDMARGPLDNALYLARLPTVEAGLAAQWRHFRGAFALPGIARRVGSGSVDVLPGCQVGVVLLNGLDYRPRPLFSYKTLTPALARANAEFFRSARAPDFVLEAPPEVDARWPDGEDALAREVVRERYEPVERERGHVLWARRATPRVPARVRQLVQRDLAFGEPLALPAGARLRLSARFAPTPFGRLVALALKSPAITLRANDGPVYRVVPGTAPLGFPVPAGRVVFGVGPLGRWCFDPVIRVQVDALEEVP